jgi:hypothetical protein
MTPLGMFNPEIFESYRTVSIPYLNYHNDIYEEIYSEPEDIMGELIENLILNEKKDDTMIINNINSSVKKVKAENHDDSLSMSPSRSEENNSQFYEEYHKSKILLKLF